MPYRREESSGDAPLRILLVTSRGTGRWVLPKGNIPRRLTPQEAAAAEAEEEAGVTGTVDPAPLGSYRYRKWRASGLSSMARVEVFALAVAQEHDDWKERAQRERRWFAPDEAADAVEEPDLAELIRAFAERAGS